ncbi:MAG: PIN domain-containing protein [Candidatus Bathyarchaeia archaeon]|nr:PIN domain-containing protein [Candidatus Bathyarchaeia archaeon]
MIDTYAWIEIFIGSEKGNKARKILTETLEIHTPDIVLAEIARKYTREGIEQQVVLERLKTIVETSETTPINMEIALESAKCYIKLLEEAKKAGITTPSLFDAIVLATAKVLKAKVITGDEHFSNLPETIWIG